ncbi:DUF6764 family protein [Nocardia sp. BMG51109]|uniref:DUF6764 family protein n=1 Tax=Nocardia sp. BMG51109 TaxID=1056816 RepID=UPI0004631B1C|nr:DUF6764 family protein [Nocardia sp. BMG51109]
MKLISAILCSAAAVGACACAAATASATDVHCYSADGRDVTVVEGDTACRAAAADSGRAHAAGFDGVGYARAAAGAVALGVGAAGGVGAGEGITGLPVAIGLGPDAYALTSLDAAPGGNRAGVAVALNGSRAQVDSSEHPVVCLGSAALAWDSLDGDGCLATPVGLWRTPASPP